MTDTPQERVHNKRMLLWAGLLTLLFCLLTAGFCRVSHAEDAHHSPEMADTSPVNAGHASEASAFHHAGDNHAEAIPLFYKLYWTGSISMVVLLIIYFFYLYKKEKYWLVKFLTFLLLFLAFSLYLIEQGQSFAGYFDPVRHLFMPGYHEANTIGFLRFIYKLTLGIALCVYGFMTFLTRQENKKCMPQGVESK
ncbi:MAG: hypothetical protein AB1847_07715 [bacterium]